MASDTLHTWGNETIDTLLTLTREAILATKPFLNDQIFGTIPLLDWLNKKAKVTKQGGASILVPLLYGKNTTFKAYSKDDVLDTTGQEGMTMAQQTWKNMGGTITVYGDEVRQNAGEKLQDLMQAKTMQAIMSARDALAIDLHASSQGSKNVIPLPIMVLASGTVQEINSGTYSWWQSQVVSGGVFAAQGLSDMRTLRNTIALQGQSGAPLPEFYLTTQTIHELYEASQLPAYRYESGDTADAGLAKMRYSTAEIAFDPNCASGVLYALHSEALQFVVHRDADWAIGEPKEPPDQDMRSMKIIWMGNLVTTNRRRLGKITGMS